MIEREARLLETLALSWIVRKISDAPSLHDHLREPREPLWRQPIEHGPQKARHHHVRNKSAQDTADANAVLRSIASSFLYQMGDKSRGHRDACDAHLSQSSFIVAIVPVSIVLCVPFVYVDVQ